VKKVERGEVGAGLRDKKEWKEKYLKSKRA